MFGFNGALFGAWASRIPAYKQQLALSEQDLSAVLFCLAIGAILSFPVAGRTLLRIRASRLSALIALAYALSFVALGMSNNLIAVCCAVFVFGAMHGAMDVAMNTWATELEADQSKTMMPFFHAMFSLGAGLGAGSGAILSGLNVGTPLHFFILLLLMSPACITVLANLDNAAELKNAQDNPPRSGLPSAKMMIIALVGFSCALGEGAMTDWAAVFTHESLGASHSEAAMAYVVFSVCMVFMRLSGGYLLCYLGKVTMLRVCACCSFAGAVLLVVTTSLPLALFGFALLGVGYSVVVPLVFSRAAELRPDHPGAGIASAATFAYGGLLLGPVVIGVLAELGSLQGAFMLLVVLSFYVLLVAKQFNEPL